MSEETGEPPGQHLPKSYVGSETRAHNEEQTPTEKTVSTKESSTNEMELFMKFMRVFTAGIETKSTAKLIKFDPDDADADIEGWCKINEVIVKHKKLTGTDLLMALTNALRGRAATCLTKLSPDNLTWESVKEHLIARFAKPMLMQDYFEQVLGFKTLDKETAADAAMRLWHLIESIPNVEMSDEVITGFAISILSRIDYNIRREFNSHNVTTKHHLCRVLGGVSLKRQNDELLNPYENKHPRSNNNCQSDYFGKCHRCGEQGHKMLNCPKLDGERSQIMMKPCLEEKHSVTCFSCGKQGHVASACHLSKCSSPMTTKEVLLCGKRAVIGELQVDGMMIVFLFDSGSKRKKCKKVQLTVPNESTQFFLNLVVSFF